MSSLSLWKTCGKTPHFLWITLWISQFWRAEIARHSTESAITKSHAHRKRILKIIIVGKQKIIKIIWVGRIGKYDKTNSCPN
nr:MAG TPA: hypothetical protein [Caudoviricetes sp.]